MIAPELVTAVSSVDNDISSLYRSLTEARLNTSLPKSPRQLLEEGVKLDAAGRLEDAALRYRQVVRIEPENAGALRRLGSVQVRQGRFAEAERSMRKVVKIAPQSADDYIELGNVSRRRGRLVDAVNSYRHALKLRPAYAGAYNNLGIALCELGRFDEAIASYRRAVEAEPSYAEAHYNLGNALTAAGRLDEAIASYRDAIASKPGYADFYNNLGNALRQQGRIDEAAVNYQKAIQLDPNHAPAYRNLGIIDFEANRLEEASSRYETALAVNPNFAEAHRDLGNTFRALGRFDPALAQYNKALAIKPRDAEAHHNLGVTLKILGRTEEAGRAFEKAIRFAPRRVVSYAGLADTRPFTIDDRHFAAIERLAQELSTLDREERLQLHFTLGKVYGDVGLYERSFRHLLDGNALKRQRINYDEAERLSGFERVRAAFTPALMQEKRGLGDPSLLPIFIAGMPRSGTTLVEQILASHPGVFGAGELTAFQDAVVRLALQGRVAQTYPPMVSSMTGAQLRELGADYVAHLRGLAPSAERITDKMPGNFVAAGLIHLALPNARIVHIHRHPIDNCLSCFSTLFATEHEYAYDLGELGRYYRGYAKLMGHWRELLPEEVMIDVQYETLVTDFEREARRIVAHCGLDWNDACLVFYRTQRPVLTASMVQVRHPIYQKSVGRWRSYKDMLGPLLEALDLDPRETPSND